MIPSISAARSRWGAESSGLLDTRSGRAALRRPPRLPRSLGAALLPTLLLIAGCAAGRAAGAADPAAELRARVLQYWAARSSGDLGAAYSFYSPAFRSRHTREDFLRNYRRLVRFLPVAAEVQELSLDARGETARVRVLVTVPYDLEGLRTEVQGASEESWVREGGRWWKLDEPVGMNF